MHETLEAARKIRILTRLKSLSWHLLSHTDKELALSHGYLCSSLFFLFLQSRGWCLLCVVMFTAKCNELVPLPGQLQPLLSSALACFCAVALACLAESPDVLRVHGCVCHTASDTLLRGQFSWLDFYMITYSADVFCHLLPAGPQAYSPCWKSDCRGSEFTCTEGEWARAVARIGIENPLSN